MGANFQKATCERAVKFSNVENSAEVLKAVMLMKENIFLTLIFESFIGTVNMLESGENQDRTLALRNHWKTIMNVISRQQFQFAFIESFPTRNSKHLTFILLPW